MTFEQFCELYAPFAFNKSVTSIYDTFPYDIQIDSSSGLYEAFGKLKEPCPACRMYFDLNGMFQFEQIPMRWTEPVHALSNQFFNLVISEDRKVNADSYLTYSTIFTVSKNCSYVSFGKPTIISVDIATPGILFRMRSTNSLYCFEVYLRPIK